MDHPEGDLLYLNAQTGTGERSGLVSKAELALQQFLGEFFGSYRVIEGPNGWLDLLAGYRYTYLGEQVGLQANNMAIGAASTQLVNQFAQSLTTPGSDLRTLIQQNIGREVNFAEWAESVIAGRPNCRYRTGQDTRGRPTGDPKPGT